MTDIEIFLLGCLAGFVAYPYVNVMKQIIKNAWRKTKEGE